MPATAREPVDSRHEEQKHETCGSIDIPNSLFLSTLRIGTVQRMLRLCRINSISERDSRVRQKCVAELYEDTVYCNNMVYLRCYIRKIKQSIVYLRNQCKVCSQCTVVHNSNNIRIIVYHSSSIYTYNLPIIFNFKNKNQYNTIAVQFSSLNKVMPFVCSSDRRRGKNQSIRHESQ